MPLGALARYLLLKRGLQEPLIEVIVALQLLFSPVLGLVQLHDQGLELLPLPPSPDLLPLEQRMEGALFSILPFSEASQTGGAQKVVYPA
jgi:hypothetical protein